MPIIINEIVIKTNVEQAAENRENPTASFANQATKAEIVKEAVEKVLEKLKEKNER